MITAEKTVSPEKIGELIGNMTLEEKAGLCSGRDFWNLKGIERLGIPSIMVTDGPHGLRKQNEESDHVGLNKSVPSTCFPTASAMAASWDRELIREIGAALGDECRQEKVSVLLGPGVNIKRSPLCGRNFEYFSEDPLLGGELAAAHIEGVQSRGIGTSLKHFAANNQETRRMMIDAVVDERSFREIYLTGFEIAVKKAQPWTVMCAYNKLNGEYCSQNRELLTDILKNEWGHEGIVVTDWGAVVDRVKGLAAGLELEMPASYGLNDRLIVRAVREGALEEPVLDEAVRRILSMILRSEETLKENDGFRYDQAAHHRLARRAAAESAVLLKNEDGLLPLDLENPSGGKKPVIAVIGEFACTPRYQGSGSSLINPSRLDNALEELKAAAGDRAEILYVPGYDRVTDRTDDLLLREAREAARRADTVLVFAGLTEEYESEGYDRTTLGLPPSHNELIMAAASENPRTAVILSNGAPVEMPWIDSVPAVLETCLGGQAWGGAAADVLLGRVNPSGKLAETFPLCLSDDPAESNFPGGPLTVEYRESIFVGYRYYATAGKEVLFPFGHGLSYTSFEYAGLETEVRSGDCDVPVRVSLTLRNTGSREGKEAVQIYIRKKKSLVIRPDRELKAFEKVTLKPGESKIVSLELDRRAFAFWDAGAKSWQVEEGEYEILAGASSADIRCRCSILLSSRDIMSDRAASRKSVLEAWFASGAREWDSTEVFETVCGRPLPPAAGRKGEPFTSESIMDDIGGTLMGRILNRSFRKALRKALDAEGSPAMERMAEAMVREMPLRQLVMLSQGKLNHEAVEALVHMVNGKFLKGLARMIKSGRK